MGVVGWLVRTQTSGFLPHIHPHVDVMREQAGFYLSEAVDQEALRLANE